MNDDIIREEKIASVNTMATGKFMLYDLVVDLIPGAIALSLAAWIIQSQIIAEIVQEFGQALPAIVFLALAYITGRTIHAITSISAIERAGVELHNVIPFIGEVKKHDRRFLYRLVTLNEKEDDGTDTVEHKTGEQAVEYLCDEITFDPKKLTYETDGTNEFAREGSIGSIHDLRYLRYLADTITYEYQSLSWKYGILSTFFRNMWLILIIAAPLYLASRILLFCFFVDGETVIYLQTLLSAIVLFVAAIVCLHQRYVFKRRQIRTKLNELALMNDSSK